MRFRALSQRSTAVALVTSVALHALTLAGARLLRDAMASRAAAPALQPIELDWVAHGDVHELGLPGDPKAAPQRKEEPLPSSGVALDPRPDTRSRGHGGSKESTEAAHRLSDSVDGLTLSTDPSTLAVSNQLSRINTGGERMSWEDRRRTPNPMELTFLAVGTGAREQRLEPAHADPASGAFGAVPRPDGTREGDTNPTKDGFHPIVVGGPTPGDEPVRALGVDHGSRREEYRRTAAVALAHPAVKQGRASISTTEYGRPNDTTDSNVEVADLVQSLITASSSGGPLGRGPGGEPGAGAPGSGGTEGPGESTRPSGNGDRGGNVLLGTNNYGEGVVRKVYPYWENAFPDWALAKGKGGVAVIGVTILADGSIRGVHVVRASGVPEFDRNVARALELAAPYAPLPIALRRKELELNISFDALNPGVGRQGPGPGRR